LVTTTITFLLVALLQNTQKRGEEALQHKLDAVADGLADLIEHSRNTTPSVGRPRRTFRATSRI
jgi:low affinity Fe/Cu permease